MIKKGLGFSSNIFKTNRKIFENYYNLIIYLFLPYPLIFIVLFLIYLHQLIAKKNMYIDYFDNLLVCGDFVHILFSLVSAFSYISSFDINHEAVQYLSGNYYQIIFIGLIPHLFITFLFIISLIFQFKNFLKLEMEFFEFFINFSIEIALVF